METARPAATLAAVTVAFLSTLSYGYVIWDREAHIPLVSSLRTQSFPFDWALVPVAPLKYHYLGDAIAAMLQSLSGDVITQFNGNPVKDSKTLVRSVADAPIGENVPVVVLREGKEMTLDVKLGRREEAEGEAVPASDKAAPGNPAKARRLRSQ